MHHHLHVLGTSNNNFAPSHHPNNHVRSSFRSGRRKALSSHYNIQKGVESESSSLSSPSPFAYAFVIGGVHEDRLAYRGFLYNVLIAVNVLRKKGSIADFVLWVQLSPDSRLVDELPGEDGRLLKALGIKVKFVEKHSGNESFAQLVLEKFRVLSMIEYRRVIFLDADIMPLVNLDYIFHLSRDGYPTVLRPNVIIATAGEPCNTALFMVTPSKTNWEIFLGIVKRQRDEGLKLPYPHFDRGRGWGHSFFDMKRKGIGNDFWEAIARNGSDWRFHAAISDQGLMFYYAKYAVMDTSIIIGPRLQNWMPGEDGNPKKVFEGSFEEITEVAEIVNQTKHAIHGRCDQATSMNFKCSNLPYRDYLHFSGPKKVNELNPFIPFSYCAFDSLHSIFSHGKPVPMGKTKSSGLMN